MSPVLRTLHAGVTALLTAALVLSGLAPASAAGSPVAIAEGSSTSTGVLAIEVRGSDATYARVEACSLDGGSCWSGYVDDDYSVRFTLPPGDYTLWIESSRGQEHVDGWWPAADAEEDAEPLTVVAGETLEVEWQLRTGATISGTASGADHDGVSGEVTLTDAAGRIVDSSRTDNNGYRGLFVMGGVRPGTYTLTARASGYTTAERTITVIGTASMVVDMTLTAQGRLIGDSPGYVTGPVLVFDLEGTQVASGTFVPQTIGRNGGWTGNFEIPDMDAGDYYVLFQSVGSAYPTWYGGSATRAGSTVVTIEPGKVTSISQTIMERSAFDSVGLTAVVRGPNEELVDAAWVSLYDDDGFERTIATTDRGVAEISGIPPGTYRIRVRDNPNSGPGDRFPYSEHWHGGSDLASAARITVTGQTSAEIDIDMPRIVPAEAGTVRGHVFIAGAAAEGAKITAIPTRSSGGATMTGFGGTAYVGSDGAYVMAGLRPGDYVFQLDDSPRWQNPAKRRFAPDALAFADATVFTMAAGRARTVDFAVDHGFVNSDAVAVRGLVSAGDTGRPVAGAEVRITPNRQWVGAESYVTQTAEDGMYEIEVWNSYPGTTVSVTAPAGYAGGARVLDLGFRDTGTRVDFALGRLPTTTAPTLSSTVRVGVATRATVSGWTSGMTLSYQWKRNGKSISGATRSSYTPVAADRGQRLTVTVGGKRSGYVTTSRTSSSRTVGYGILSLPTPKISGTRKVGATLTAVRGAGISGAAYSYQWYSQRTAISGATRSKRTLTWREGGDRITVKVTVRKPGYTTLSKTSSMTARIAW